MDLQQQREQAHAWLDQLAPAKLGAVHTLLEVMVGEDDDSDLYTEENIRRFRESQAHNATGGKGVPMEDVLADFGLTPADFPLTK
ncbi:MAG: hypothetical protein FJW38_21145 [Acidobacteria bacterium]|nr:hypothetical protein [Acidobacteriota bacterium]